jgi:hypothetical protein
MACQYTGYRHAVTAAPLRAFDLMFDILAPGARQR